MNWLESLLLSPVERKDAGGRTRHECRARFCSTCGATEFRARLRLAIRSCSSHPDRERTSSVLNHADLDVLAAGLRDLPPWMTAHPWTVHGLILVICTWFYETDDRDALDGTSAGDLVERMIDHHTRIHGRDLEPVRHPTDRTSARWRSSPGEKTDD